MDVERQTRSSLDALGREPARDIRRDEEPGAPAMASDMAAARAWREQQSVAARRRGGGECCAAGTARARYLCEEDYNAEETF